MKRSVFLLIPLLFVGYHLPVSGAEPQQVLERQMDELDNYMKELKSYMRKLKMAVVAQILKIKQLENQNRRLERQIERARQPVRQHNNFNDHSGGR